MSDFVCGLIGIVIGCLIVMPIQSVICGFPWWAAYVYVPQDLWKLVKREIIN